MKSTEILIREHRLILQVLFSLSEARQQLETGKHPPKLFFVKALVFCRQYADKFHHYKEEYLLFGLLAHKKMGELDLAIGALRHQHEKCRSCLDTIENALVGYEMGNEIAITSLLENLAVYVALLKRHIHYEDHVFFPMAEKELIPEEDEALLVQFEAEHVGIGADNLTADCRKLAADLATLLG